jgi:hypothetical protein
VWLDLRSQPLHRLFVVQLLTPLPDTASELLLEYFLLLLTVHLCIKLPQPAALELVSGRASEPLKNIIRT